MSEELLKPYPVIIEIPVAWGEMDAFGHVNNAVYFRYFESARIAYFEQFRHTAVMKQQGLGRILASAQCRYKFPLTYPDTVSVGARVTGMKTDRFTMECAALSHCHRKIAAVGHAEVVSFNYRENVKAPLPPELRQEILAVEGRGIETVS